MCAWRKKLHHMFRGCRRLKIESYLVYNLDEALFPLPISYRHCPRSCNMYTLFTDWHSLHYCRLLPMLYYYHRRHHNHYRHHHPHQNVVNISINGHQYQVIVQINSSIITITISGRHEASSGSSHFLLIFVRICSVLSPAFPVCLPLICFQNPYPLLMISDSM